MEARRLPVLPCGLVFAAFLRDARCTRLERLERDRPERLAGRPSCEGGRA